MANIELRMPMTFPNADVIIISKGDALHSLYFLAIAYNSYKDGQFNKYSVLPKAGRNIY
ncbi:hypothetical protein [Pseudanabaena sp. BC1403]|uniref:hypothetical protein n=1 Tax=Pseudanabaena sp. BC1403 TaxID=2043171 RepID=UPI0015E1AC8D|nr:hypothetical protein [Pseudanabaena sp. BC1403]